MNRRRFLKATSTLFAASFSWVRSVPSLAQSVPFGFWKKAGSNLGPLQSTQLIVSVASGGSSTPRLRTTQAVMQVACTASTSSRLQTTQAVMMAAANSGSGAQRVTQVTLSVLVVP